MMRNVTLNGTTTTEAHTVHDGGIFCSEDVVRTFPALTALVLATCATTLVSIAQTCSFYKSAVARRDDPNIRESYWDHLKLSLGYFSVPIGYLWNAVFMLSWTPWVENSQEFQATLTSKLTITLP